MEQLIQKAADAMVKRGFIVHRVPGAQEARELVLSLIPQGASVGLGGIGSVSLPFSSGSEALVKVGSETIASDKFYDSFFELVRKYLADDSAKAE